MQTDPKNRASGLIPVVLEDPSSGIRLVPFTEGDAGDMERLAEEPGVYENTYIPARRDPGFARRWVAMYLSGWVDGADGKIWIADFGGTDIVRVNPNGEKFKRFNVGGGPQHIVGH